MSTQASNQTPRRRFLLPKAWPRVGPERSSKEASRAGEWGRRTHGTRTACRVTGGFRERSPGQEGPGRPPHLRWPSCSNTLWDLITLRAGRVGDAPGFPATTDPGDPAPPGLWLLLVSLCWIPSCPFSSWHWIWCPSPWVWPPPREWASVGA